MDATQTPTAGQCEPAVTLEAAAPWAADPECDCSVCESVNSAARWATLDAMDPAPADEEPFRLPDEDMEQLTLLDWVTRQSARYRLMGTEAADMLADHIAALAADIRTFRASAAGELDARRDLHETWREMDELSRQL